MGLLGLLLTPLALAHLPHTNVAGAAIPVHDPDLPWYMGIDNEMPLAMYRSTDRGLTWEAFNAPVMSDEITDGAYTDDGVAVLLGVAGYWWTTDGATWSQVSLPTLPSGLISPLAGGDQIYLAGTDGIYVGAPGEPLTLDLAEGRASSVHDGDDGPIAILDDGHVWWRHRGRWEDLGIPDSADPASSGTSADGGVWAGTDGGRVYAWNGSAWGECGVVPGGDLDTSHSQITHMDARDGRLVVTRGDTGPAVSDDGCSTFTLSTGPIHNDFVDVAPASSYTTNDRSFVTLVTVGDTLFAAGWDGAEITTDAGATWHISPTVGADFTEGLDLSQDFNTDGAAIFAAYGAGFTASEAFGASTSAYSLGYSLSNAQQVEIPDDAEGLTPAYAIVNMVPYRSDDGGVNWTQIRGPFTLARLLDLGPGSRVYAENVDTTTSTPGHVLRSEDGGANWTSFSTLPAEVASGVVQRVIDRPGFLCFMTSAQVACSTDDGATWTDVHATGSTSLRHLSMFAWPDAAPTHLLVSDQAGVYLWDGSALTTVTEGVTWPFTLGVATDDDRLFAVDHGGRVMESPDGGTSWTDTGGRLSAPVRMMRARPDFAHFPDLLAGGVDGTFVIHAGTVERYAAFQSVDDGTQYVSCPTCVSESTPDAILGEVRTLAAPGTTEVNLRGTTLVVRGKSRAGAQARVWVDGTLVATATVKASEDVRTALIRVDGLEDRWHRLEVQVDVGELSVDTYEGSGPGAVLATTWEEPGDSGETGGQETADTSADTDDTAPPDETGDPTGDTSSDDTGAPGETGQDPAKAGCGCAAEPAPAVPWALLLGGLLIRRRRSAQPADLASGSDQDARRHSSARQA